MSTGHQAETKPVPDDGILSPDDIDLQLPPIGERPLVTFAVFAYNQEKYIRDAVEGAFAQTYQPLEIILSDDCSTDRTFEIMEEMAAAYYGPHTIRVRRHEVNVGTLAHLLGVAEVAGGDYLIVAAGDDVSLPERTSVLAGVLGDNECLAVSSSDTIIGHSGEILELAHDREISRVAWRKNDPGWLHGATAGYRVKLLRNLPLPVARVLHEDRALSGIIRLTGGSTIYLSRPLIRYRWHANNLSERIVCEETIIQAELRQIGRNQHSLAADEYSLKAVKDMRHRAEIRPDIDKLVRLIRWNKLFARWMELNRLEKITLLTLSAATGKLGRCLPRMFGQNFFVFCKKCDRAFSKYVATKISR